MQVLDHFEILELAEGKFTVVDRSVVPARTVAVCDSYEQAQEARDRVAVVPAEWMQDELLQAVALALSERGIPYASVVSSLERLGEDSVWALVDESLERIEQVAGLRDESA